MTNSNPHPSFLPVAQRSRSPGTVAAIAVVAALASPPPAQAEEPGFVHVLHVATDDGQEYPAITLTKALEAQAIRQGKPKLANTNKDLTATLREAKCGKAFVEAVDDRRRLLGPDSDGVIDEACRRRVAGVVGAPLGAAEAYVWGYLYVERGRRWVKAHLWQKGQPERVKALPYGEGDDERVAQRLWRHLWQPGRVADVRVVGAGLSEGDLYIDGARQERVSTPAFETTLGDGEHLFEVRSGAHPLASARVTLIAGGAAQEVRLLPAAESLGPKPSAGPRSPTLSPPPPAAPPARGPSALPWVLGGVSLAGFVGAGAFFALRQGAEGKLGERCATYCPPNAQHDIDRSNLMGTLSLVSLGAGVVAGAGTLTWALHKGSGEASPPRVIGSVRPLVGGGALGISGSF